MVDYVTITDAQIDPEAPITSELMSALRDNPIAIAEGAPGAPTVAARNVRQTGSATWYPPSGPHQLNSGTLSLQEGKYIVSMTASFLLRAFENPYYANISLYHYRNGTSVLLDNQNVLVSPPESTVNFVYTRDIFDIYVGDYFYMLQADTSEGSAQNTTATLTLEITGPYKTEGYITAMSSS